MVDDADEACRETRCGTNAERKTRSEPIGDKADDRCAERRTAQRDRPSPAGGVGPCRLAMESGERSEGGLVIIVLL